MIKILTKNTKFSSGVIVPTMVMIMIILTVSALALADFAVNHFDRINTNYFATNSLLTAEAGAEQTLYELNSDDNFAGYTTEQQLFSDDIQGRATYQTQVTEGSVANEKIIISTGRIYRRTSDTTPELVRKVRLTVVGTTTQGYSVQTGPGGLILSNSATIANGRVNVNGYLSMSNSSRIGSAQTPVDVNVAHVNCPTTGGATFPTQCTSGQPITLTNTASIYGEVCATNQTNGSQMYNPGLVNGCEAPPTALPEHDRLAQITAIGPTLTGSAASCSHNQTRTFAANTKIVGNLYISNSCQVTVNGDLWITGNFTISNSASIRVGSAVTSRPAIMIDGVSGANFTNNTSVIANANNIGFQFLTYWSAATCSPNCTDVTGQDLYNSRNTSTINIANSSLGAGSLFYARWSKVRVSNGGSIGALIGQTVELNNSGNISFGTNISSGQNVWSIKNYQQIFD